MYVNFATSGGVVEKKDFLSDSSYSADGDENGAYFMAFVMHTWGTEVSLRVCPWEYTTMPYDGCFYSSASHNVAANDDDDDDGIQDGGGCKIGLNLRDVSLRP